MCNCSNNNSCGCDSSVDLPYLQGANGQNGIFGGFSSKWTFKTQTSVSPLTSTIRFNNATLASATAIYINKTDAYSNDLTGFLASFENGGAYGLIRVFKEYEPENVYYGEITSVVENSTYFAFIVTYIDDAGSFAADDNLVVSFAQSGLDGDDGNATALAYVLESNITDPYIDQYDNSDGAIDLPASLLTVPLNTLSANGDCAQFEYLIKMSTGADDSISIKINNTNIGNFKLPEGDTKISIEVCRVSSTKVYATAVVHNALFNTAFSGSGYILEQFVTVSDLATNAFTGEIATYDPLTSGITLSVVKAQSKIFKINA